MQIFFDVHVQTLLHQIAVERGIPAVEPPSPDREGLELGKIDGLIGLDLHLLRERARSQEDSGNQNLHIRVTYHIR
ncbi:MAG: hypothetical protein ACRD30_09080 [Bryobacteraceae bacterium]